MLRLRLARFGCKNRPFYRVVAISSKRARDAQPIEYVGTYDPLPSALDSTKEVRLRLDRVKYWLAVGAQPSPRVSYLLWRAGLLPAPPIPHTPTQWIPKQVRRDAAKSKKSFSTWTGGAGGGGGGGGLLSGPPRMAGFAGFARAPPLAAFR